MSSVTERPAARVARTERSAGGRARLDLHSFLPSGRSLLVGLALVVLAAALYAGARFTPAFALQTLEVRGARGDVAREVRRALEPLRGTSLVALDRDAVESALRGVPSVASWHYDRRFPETLRVTVRPDRPVAVLRQGAQSWLVSGRGRILRSLPGRSAGRLPRVWLPAETEVRVGGSATGDAATVAAALAPLVGDSLLRRVREARAEEGTVTVFLRSGTRLLLGPPTDSQLKLEIAKRIVPGLRGAPAVLDLSVPERPVLALSNPQVEG